MTSQPKQKLARTPTKMLASWKPFGNPALLPGEKATDFRRLLAEATEEYSPRTLQQHLILWDVAVVTLRIERFRRIEAGLIHPHGDCPSMERKIALSFMESIDSIELNQKLITTLERRRDALFRELARLEYSPGSQAPKPITLDLASQDIDDDQCDGTSDGSQ